MYEIENPYTNYDKTEDLNSIPKILSNITYQEFFENFLIRNKPCIIKNIADNWPATNNWVDNNKPNFSYIRKYKDLEACVSNCKERYFNAQKTECYSVEKYIIYWKNYIENGYAETHELLYLKDWHLRKNSGDDFYKIPIYFSSDWLNEYFSEKTDDDYMFVYMGPKGSWTPFHVDVFTSFSWSTNICGKKKWILFPPGEENKVKDALGNLPYDITKCKTNTTHFEIIQDVGEAIFVPSGWHHQVWNLDDTISINHNWINGCNIKNMWVSLADNLTAVKKEISDCIDMDEWLNQCQFLLKASYGVDFKMFYSFLYHIGSKRINMLEKNGSFKLFSDYTTGKNHALFDLIKIKEVLDLFTSHEDFNSFKFVDEDTKISPKELCDIINNVLLKNK